MRFCEKCGSYVRATKAGFECTKCGNKILTETVDVKTMDQNSVPPIEVAIDSTDAQSEVTETCPLCGNSRALHSILFISGEHAGVRQERAIERFTCTKCRHQWTKQ